MMKSTGAFDLKEPKIQKEEILVVKDSDRDCIGSQWTNGDRYRY
jgi:hypothetical protein